MSRLLALGPSVGMWRVRASRLAASESARGAALSLGLKVASSALNLLMLTLLARSMGVHEFGVFALWFNAIAFLTLLAGCGQEKLILRSWSEYGRPGQEGLARGALRFGIRLTLAGALATALAVVAAGWWMGSDPLLVGGAAAFLIVQTLFFFSVYVSRAAVGIGASDGHDLTWRIVVCIAAAIALAAAFRPTAGHFFVVAGLAMGLALIWQAVTTWRRMPQAVRLAPPRAEPRLWTARSLKMASAGLLEGATQFLEVIAVGLILSPTAAGAYFVASRLANLFSMITGGFESFATRQIARGHYGAGGEAVRATLRHLALVTGGLVAIGLVGIAAAGPHLLALFGADFVEQYPVLVVLSLGTAAVALAGHAPALLLLTGQEGTYTAIIGAAVLVRMTAIVALASVAGPLGAAAASSAAAVATAVALNIACRRLAGFDPAVTLLLPGRRSAP